MDTKEGTVIVVLPKLSEVSISLLGGSLLSSAELLLNEDQHTIMKTEECCSSVDVELASQDLEVRHITNLNLKSYIDQIRATYTCDPLECPSLRERLDKHRQTHHTSEQTDVILEKNCSTLTTDPPTNDQRSGFVVPKKSRTPSSPIRDQEDRFSRLYGEKAQVVKDAYIDDVLTPALNNRYQYNRRASRVNEDIRSKYNEDIVRRLNRARISSPTNDNVSKNISNKNGKVSMAIGGNISTVINNDNEEHFDEYKNMYSRRPSRINGEIRNKFIAKQYSMNAPSTNTEKDGYNNGYQANSSRLNIVAREYIQTPRNSVADEVDVKGQRLGRNNGDKISPVRISKMNDDVNQNQINGRLRWANEEVINGGYKNQRSSRSRISGRQDGKNVRISKVNTDFTSPVRSTIIERNLNNNDAANKNVERISRMSNVDRAFPIIREFDSETLGGKPLSVQNGCVSENGKSQASNINNDEAENRPSEIVGIIKGNVYKNDFYPPIDQIKYKLHYVENNGIHNNGDTLNSDKGTRYHPGGTRNMGGKNPKADCQRQADEAQTKLTFSNLGDFQINMNSNIIDIDNDGEEPFKKTYLKTDTLDISPQIHCNDKKCKLYGVRHRTTNIGCTYSKCFIPKANTETVDILPEHLNTYYSDIRREVKNWIEKLMLYLNPGCQATEERDNAVNDLIENILHLHEEEHADDYDDLVKWIAKDMLVKLPLWYPGRDTDVDDFVQNHIIELLNAVKLINNKWNHRIYENTCCMKKKLLERGSKSDHGFRCTLISDKICDKLNAAINKKKDACRPFCKSERYLLEYEIMNWLSQYKIVTPDGSTISKRDIMNIVLEKITPLLNKPYNPTNKIILKAKIVQILDGLPICVNCTKKQRLQMVKNVDELANKLLSVQLGVEEGKIKVKRINTGNNKPIPNVIDTSINRKEVRQNLEIEQRERLEKTFLDVIRNCVGKTKGDQNYIEERILEVLFNNLDAIKINNVDYATVEILEILHISNELSLTDSIGVADCILKSCKEGIHNHLNFNYTGDMQTLLSNPLQSQVVVYKTETESDLSSNINKEEKSYVEHIAKIVKAWVANNSARFDNVKDNKDFILELASDIVDQVKLEQLVPRPDIDKPKWWMYFIFRLLNKQSIYETIEEAEPQIKGLVDKLATVKVPNFTRNHETKYVFTASTQVRDKSQSKGKKADKKSQVSPKGNKSKKDQKDTKAGTSKEDSSRTEHDAALHKYVQKYLEHNYDVSEPMARRAYLQVLKSELEKVDEPTRKEVYETLLESVGRESFSPDSFALELEYIKDISDWLNDLPIDSSFNAVGNKDRIEFVDDLAQSLIGENESAQNSIINKHIKKLHLSEEYENNVPMMIDMLSKRIQDRRRVAAFNNNSCVKCCKSKPNFDEFLEESIRVNGPELSNDEKKLEAWTKRIVDEVKKNAAENDPSKLTKAKVYEKMANASPNSMEPLKRFSCELGYAQEISEWLKNLPLEDANTNVSVRLIGDLAEKICERDANKAKDKCADNKLRQYVSDWIRELPVDNQVIDTPTAVQQLMQRINTTQLKKSNKRDSVTQTESNGANSKIEKPDKKSGKRLKSSGIHDNCCEYKAHCASEPEDFIVDAVDKWVSSLPVSGNDIRVTETKNNIARKLYQKLGELNTNPRTQKDDLNYSNYLTDEIDTQLANVPLDTHVLGDREKIRDSLVAEIIAAKKVLAKSYPNDTYRQKLEDSAATKLPTGAPAVDLYKRRLVDLFVLENFDQTSDNAKEAYVQTIKDEIDGYGNVVREATGLDTEQMFNTAYGNLFRVPIPDEKILEEEVEEVKSKYDIKRWFDILPKRDPTYIEELANRDELLTILTQNIHDVQKKEPNNIDVMRNVVINWLHKTDLFTGQENRFDDYAIQLITSLRAENDAGKCCREAAKKKEAEKEVTDNNKSNKEKAIKEKDRIPKQKEVKQQKSKVKDSSVMPTSPERRRSNDLVSKLIESWINEIPITTSTPQDLQNIKSIKENLATSIMMKVNNLNSDSITNYDNNVYDSILSVDIDKALSSLPIDASFEKSKEGKKEQLIQALHALEPHLARENDRINYRKTLKDITSRNMEEPVKSNADKMAMLDNIKDNIVDNFIVYKYNKDDDNAQQIPKNNIKNAMSDHLNKVLEIMDVSKLPIEHREQMRANHLITELGKVPAPDDGALRDEVQEIKMKEQLDNHFSEFTCPKDGKKFLKSSTKNCLAKELVELEKNGHTLEKDLEMKAEITKAFREIGKEISPVKIDTFIQKLRENEAERKILPFRKAAPSDYSMMDNGMEPAPSCRINGQMYTSPNASVPQPYYASQNVSLQQPQYIMNNPKSNSMHLSFAAPPSNITRESIYFNREHSLAMLPNTPLKHDPTHHEDVIVVREYVDDASFVEKPVVLSSEYGMLLPSSQIRHPSTFGRLSYNPGKGSYASAITHSLGPNQRFTDRSIQWYTPSSAYNSPQDQNVIIQAPDHVLDDSSYSQSIPQYVSMPQQFRSENSHSVYNNNQSFPSVKQHGSANVSQVASYSQVSEGVVPWSQSSVSPQWVQQSVQVQMHHPNQTAYNQNANHQYNQGQDMPNNPPVYGSENAPDQATGNPVPNAYGQVYVGQFKPGVNGLTGEVQNDTESSVPLVTGEAFDNCGCPIRIQCPMYFQYCDSIDDFIPFCPSVQPMSNVMPYCML